MIPLFQAGGSSALLMDLAANEKSVHSDFFNGQLMTICITVLIYLDVYCYFYVIINTDGADIQIAQLSNIK